MPGMQGKGIRLKALLDIPALAVKADHVAVHSGDGKYSACLTLEQAKSFGLLVYELDGAPFPESKGGPFRLVTPGLGDLCANVKGVAVEALAQYADDVRTRRFPGHEESYHLTDAQAEALGLYGHSRSA